MTVYPSQTVGSGADSVPFSSSHAASLIATGFTMGVLHVVAGPDHLSALATLAVGSSWKALTLGIRWGLGHSAGLLVVAAIFIALKGELDLRILGRYCDFLVGVFMVILGIYACIDSVSMYQKKRSKKDSKEDPIDAAEKESLCSNHGSPWSTEADSSINGSTLNSFCPTVDMQDPITQRIVSFLIGLLHGVAGPGRGCEKCITSKSLIDALGGILGVLPAVEMRSWKSSFTYLGTFVVTSTLSMGTFASIYGELTKRLGSTTESMELGLRVFSAAMSITVGLLWLVLSALGKLEEFFH